jgi:hypothetical protein
MGNAYVDNAVPGNSFVADIKRGGTGSPTTVAASVVFESFVPGRPTEKSLRPDIYKGPNGWLMTDGQHTASGTCQIATGTTETPKNGDWFSIIIDRKVGSTAQTWVFDSISDPQNMGEYAKVNFTCLRAYNPPA